ncbi:hypothetical protein GKC30_11705 [Pseudodesulfovibrio sp. F-1]|uniref:Uncharacterized protein n=1 Tax=Pseudodesulfovibrio alkaliphilus TaxID=2661613 RepID=A0A7K1KQQ3_9BACT|nr:hypothetical protein [Pseudodesulfovibrio alkaliphilus]MUM78300.1 hypothetical protein [Pseudodesulfovibrio alkaliphilus]
MLYLKMTNSERWIINRLLTYSTIRIVFVNIDFKKEWCNPVRHCIPYGQWRFLFRLITASLAMVAHLTYVAVSEEPPFRRARTVAKRRLSWASVALVWGFQTAA